MHRSGTSAVAGLTARLGLATCVPDDLIAGQPWNPSGHWESRSLTRLNDRLLAEMGATWWSPPPSGAGYATVAGRIATSPDEAAGWFDRAHPTGPWVWKDPRTCCTLPFWRRALDGPVAGIVVFRHPLDVAASLRARNSFPVPFGVALWERTNRLLLEHAGGMPLLVTSYDDLVGDPVAWTELATGFLFDLDLPVRTGPDLAEAVAGFVDPSLRHSSRSAAGDDGALPPGTAAVLDALREGVGTHRAFAPPALDVEDPQVSAELGSYGPDRPPGWNRPPWAEEARP
jgi:hypothetical protein